MAKRSYTDDFKAEALAVYESDGPAATARLYEMPVRTLKDWAKLHGVHTGADSKAMTETANACLTARRARIRVKLAERAEEMLDRMAEGMDIWVGSGATPVKVTIDKPPASVCREFATSCGILIDKLRLEQGESTSREEVRHDYSDRSDEDLIAEANRITRDAALRK